MTVTINESGMQFGPFDDGNILPIETCKSYKKIKKNVPIVEFMLSRPSGKSPNAIWAIEAKTTMSNPGSKADFKTNIQDICIKFINSVHLFLSGLTQRNVLMESEIPSGMNHITATNMDLKLILVIKKSQVDWLPPVRDALNRELQPLIKTLSLNSPCVFVFNEETARKKHLIS